MWNLDGFILAFTIFPSCIKVYFPQMKINEHTSYILCCPVSHYNILLETHAGFSVMWKRDGK